ncbi:MAG: hypothetical protein P8Y53_07110 [Pseudolabrys sp.]|jgi:hypothetical protein
MVSLRTLLVSAAALAVFGSAAQAAGISSAAAAARSAAAGRAGSWRLVLRGDLGAIWGELDGAESTPSYTDPTASTLGTGFVAGVVPTTRASGCAHRPHRRLHLALRYSGTVASSDDTTAKVEAATVLFNGYLDLGTWYRATI